MEIPPEKVFLAQKIMIAKCNLVGKPVICATQMLESMCKAPRPTRAEAGDVANAILDGADAVMLSGETAGGDFPVESVNIMRKIAEEAENSLDYLSIFVNIRSQVLARDLRMTPTEALASSAVKTAADAGAACILVFSASGGTVATVAKYRPKAPVLALTDSEYVARTLQTSRGVSSFVTAMDVSFDTLTQRGIEYAKKIGIPGMVSGAAVVVVGEEQNEKIVKLATVP
jgi:pyruvate kinase